MWQVAPNKTQRDKANGDFRDGVFLDCIWRTTEYLIGIESTIYKCHTARPRPVGANVDRKCVDYIHTRYFGFVIASTQPIQFTNSSNAYKDLELFGFFLLA